MYIPTSFTFGFANYQETLKITRLANNTPPTRTDAESYVKRIADVCNFVFDPDVQRGSIGTTIHENIPNANRPYLTNHGRLQRTVGKKSSEEELSKDPQCRVIPVYVTAFSASDYRQARIQADLAW